MRFLRQEIISLLTFMVLATIAMAVLALIRPDDSAGIVRWWLITLTCVVLFTATSVLSKMMPIYRKPGRARKVQALPYASRPERVVQIERMVTSAKWSQREFRARLRPLLARIAAQRLVTYRNIDPASDPDAARAILGDATWTTLEATVISAGNEGPGLSVDDVHKIVTTMEDIGGPTRFDR